VRAWAAVRQSSVESRFGNAQWAPVLGKWLGGLELCAKRAVVLNESIASSRPSGNSSPAFCRSATWTGCRSQMARPVTVERSSGTDSPLDSRLASPKRDQPEHLVIDDSDLDNICLANVGGVLGNRLQHRLHVTRRIGDHAENVADRRLLLQRRAKAGQSSS
jgi:hypothetical protein